MSSSTPKFSLKLQKKSSKKTDTSNLLGGDFDDAGDGTSDQARQQEQSTAARKMPLVIPSGENKLKLKLSKEDDEAAQALMQGGNQKKDDEQHSAGGGNALKIDMEKRETQQYKTDLEELPEELTVDSESYQKVPIAEFGAALLRGMGWKEDEGAKKKKKASDEETLPRPHRLGLGATPKLMDLESMPTGRRRPDQVKRQEALIEQQREYQKQRERQKELDKQRTLQDGSLIWLKNGKRARVLQLVGVPGLNMVKVQVEKETEASVVKRGDMDGLVSREELEELPFKEAKVEIPRREERDESKKERKGDDRKSSREQKKEKRKREEDRPEKSSKRKREETSSKPQWAIPNIRVRIVSEKLGRRHFKEKGVVVDVTPSGVTVQMDGGSLLDRVPERYLETALPKPGGKAIVLAGDHKYVKGQLLERTSRKGVIQAYEDMNTLSLELDDMAEWCGPLDEDMT